MKVRIEIDTQTFVRFWLVVIGFALAGLLIYSARTALIIIGVAFFLALALNKPVVSLAKLLPGKSRVGGTALAFTAVVAFLGIFGVLVVPPVVEQSVKFAQTIPDLVTDAQGQWGGLNDFIQNYNLQPQIDSAVMSVRENAAAWAAGLSKDVITGISSFASFMVALLLTLVLAFLMLVEGPEWMRRVWSLYHDKTRMKSHQKLVKQMYLVVANYVSAQILVAGIAALAAGAVVFILSFIFPVPANVSMPVIALTFVLSLVPMFGSTIAGVLAAILIGLNDVTAAVIYSIYFIIYQQVENNFISPLIQSKSIELSALAVLASATIGIYMLGIIGGIIAIPIAGCIKVLLEDYLERTRHERKKSDSALKKLAHKISE